MYHYCGVNLEEAFYTFLVSLLWSEFGRSILHQKSAHWPITEVKNKVLQRITAFWEIWFPLNMHQLASKIFPLFRHGSGVETWNWNRKVRGLNLGWGKFFFKFLIGSYGFKKSEKNNFWIIRARLKYVGNTLNVLVRPNPRMYFSIFFTF